MDSNNLVLLTIITIFGSLLLRVLYILIKIYAQQNKLNGEKKSLKVILCIGSGGHTTELLKIVTKMNLTKYSPRLYMMADSDNNSEAKINSAEKDTKDYQICKIPRSRNVHQPYMTSIFSTLHAVLYCVPPILRFRPDVIICNGPGTCIPICFVVFLMRCSYILDCRIVFIESLCRVRTLSLSGKILQFIADIFVVQWPQLHRVSWRTMYFGRLT
ncbi:UDP-N-acetylglucosamine transferase subunit ALG14 homolog [Leptidea sinapis]|uniref:UDP-N-acetylglucosamine transferase subunit ALG14 homolog n=1 Tax=Leptidea sinapis TaxID=189913 RepID=UPI0021C28BCA|nr:UDP-N-acetylglucosamine transferase subunit ALG14 homolog [Leptidea sinapis]